MSLTLESFENSHECQLARGFDQLVEAILGSDIDIVTVAGGCASLLTTYLVELKPSDRVLILSQLVDAILSGINANYDHDLPN